MASETEVSAMENPQTSATSEQWTIDQLESALAHLERLQDQIDHLRSAIPSLVKPLYSRKRSYSDILSDNPGARTRAHVFTGVRNAANQTTEDLRVLGETWRSEETQGIFERVRESEAREGNLGRGVEVPGWGWGEKVQVRSEGEGKAEGA